LTSQPIGPVRRLVPVAFALLLAAALFLVARSPGASANERASLASRFRFTEMPIALPPGLPQHPIRQVNAAYYPIRAWVSSVGAAIAANDIAGTGVSGDLCLVDTRSDSAIVTPAPDNAHKYAPFVLNPAPLPVGPGVAPMGCVPGDFNGDGRTDLLVYFWGRTPVLFMHRPGAQSLTLSAFEPTELVPQLPSPDGTYHGPLWNTNAVSVADFDGDGHPDIGVFNYFPDSPVLDPKAPANVHMNKSMSHARNAGGAHILRWISATTGNRPSARFQEQDGAIDPGAASGWTLGASSADLDGDMLPELYLANDFGHDRMFHNVSTVGKIRFQQVQGRRGAFTPKSMVMGHDSFKGMSVDFGDIDNNGSFDIFVSNITTSWGLEESNFLWMNNTRDAASARAKLERGTAPFDNKAAAQDIAWTGWGWDAKMADLDNSGQLAVVQTDGFVKGEINRWNWLQELAASNDMLLENPSMWPKAGPGDDIAGSQKLAFWARRDDGRFQNISSELGLDVPIPTRGVAVADTTADGGQDFAVARQWGPPAFYHNDNAGKGAFLGLRLYRPAAGGASAGTPDGGRVVGTPAYGATVQIRTANGHTQIAQLDGGGGHSGKRSFDLYFGLGSGGSRPVSATLCWRDLDGAKHTQTLDLTSGWHDLMLTTQASEVSAS
jgi:enediyne biosynthesis protein E4